MQKKWPFIRMPRMGNLQDFHRPKEIILRDHLALERTRLANERTLMSYIRTSLYLILGGIAFMQLETLGEIRWLGLPTLALSVFLIVFGAIRYVVLRKKLKQYYPEEE